MSKFNQMLAKLSEKQIALARRFQDAGITSYSQAIKAFANRDDARIEAWKVELNAYYDAHPHKR